MQPPPNLPITDRAKLVSIIGSRSKWWNLNDLMKEWQAALDIARLLSISGENAEK